jgi:hypothetical protein
MYICTREGDNYALSMTTHLPTCLHFLLDAPFSYSVFTRGLMAYTFTIPILEMLNTCLIFKIYILWPVQVLLSNKKYCFVAFW